MRFLIVLAKCLLSREGDAAFSAARWTRYGWWQMHFLFMLEERCVLREDKLAFFTAI
jgi:hypothetical protein